MTLVLLVAAVAVAFGTQLLAFAKAHSDRLPSIEPKHIAAAALVAAAAYSWSRHQEGAPSPAPGPTPDHGIVLRGKFSGPDASADAATTAALLEELAAEIEWDGMQAEPLLKSGQAVDQLRMRARELRCRGVSLGDKHPRAREAIKEYLDHAAGTSGGPLSFAQRAAWVAAYRDVARAAADASR
jgi:hypothetical protein